MVCIQSNTDPIAILVASFPNEAAVVFRLGYSSGDWLLQEEIRDKRIQSWVALWNTVWLKKPMLDATMEAGLKIRWLGAWKRRLLRAGRRAVDDMNKLGDPGTNWPIVILQSYFI